MTARTAKETLNRVERMNTWRTTGNRVFANSTTISTNPKCDSKVVLETVETIGGKQTECQLYQRGRCHYGEHCKYLHVLRTESVRASEVSASTSRATESTDGSRHTAVNDISSTSGESLNRGRTNSAENAYPVRNGAADCQYYLKTGKCNYGSRCKFNHPFRDENLVNALNRRDCFDFVQKGTCPYGRNCKYNHPTPGDGALGSIENQTSSSSESSASSPRSVSRSIPRRSVSEPRYSTKRDLSEDSPASREKLPQTKGRAVQPPSKWETSPDSPASLAKKLANDSRRREIGGFTQNVHQPQSVPKTVANAWSQNTNAMSMPNHQNTTRSIPSRRIVEPFPAVPAPLVRPLVSQDGYFAHSHLPEPKFPPANWEFRAGNHMHPQESMDSNGWIVHNRSSGMPSVRMSSPPTPVSTSLDRADFPEATQAQMHFLQTSIWRNDVTIESQGRTVNVPRHSFEYENMKPSAMVPPRKMRAMAPVLTGRGYDGLQVAEWAAGRGHLLADRAGRGVSMPLLPDLSGYGMTEASPSDYVHVGMTRGSQHHRHWGLHGASNGMSHNIQDIQHMHHQQHLQTQQQHLPQAQIHHQPVNPLRQHPDRASAVHRFLPESIEFAGLGGTRQEYLDVGTQMQQNSNSVLISPGKVIGSERKVHWDGRSFDPMGYKSSLFGNDSFGLKECESLDNVWKPTEKSSMFGPGLFGMQHGTF